MKSQSRNTVINADTAHCCIGNLHAKQVAQGHSQGVADNQAINAAMGDQQNMLSIVMNLQILPGCFHTCLETNHRFSVRRRILHRVMPECGHLVGMLLVKVIGCTPFPVTKTNLSESIIHLQKEERVITLTGIVRSEDVRVDNTVPSYCIAMAQINYQTQGPASDGARRGWLTAVFDFINPF